MNERPRITLAPRDGSRGMDPDEFLLHHRTYHERQRRRIEIAGIVFAVLWIVVLVALWGAYR